MAYFDCRRRKRNTESALRFELHLERNLVDLYQELLSGAYSPGRSICFVIKHPKYREVWAADFRDRIVHHLLYNRIAPRFHAGFIADSCACIPERGTLYAVERLEHKVRSITLNWRLPAFYLKLDLANFFVSIDKSILFGLLARKIHEPWWLDLAGRLLWHNCCDDYEFKGRVDLLERVPPHKRLTSQHGTHGLPIGNLSSQFLANIYLDVLDQHVKHYIRARHYVRYVDDFIVLGQSTDWLEAVHYDIAHFLPAELGLQLNESKRRGLRRTGDQAMAPTGAPARGALCRAPHPQRRCLGPLHHRQQLSRPDDPGQSWPRRSRSSGARCSAPRPRRERRPHQDLPECLMTDRAQACSDAIHKALFPHTLRIDRMRESKRIVAEIVREHFPAAGAEPAKAPEGHPQSDPSHVAD